MIPIVDPVAGMDQRHGNVVPGVDLRQLDAGWAGAENRQRARQLASRRALHVGPWVRLGEAGEVGHTAHRSDGEDDGTGLQLAVVDANAAGPGERWPSRG